MRLPDFLCIGAMRCGTTTLWELLDRHEQVFLPQTKELHFFDNRDGAFERGVAAYSSYFEDALPSAVCGESSPSYLFVPEAAERIEEMLPDVRLIAILRDPVARAWSHYWFNVRRGREWLDFDDALDREEQRTSSEKPMWREWFAYVGRGKYAEQLQRYEELFPRQQLLVVLLDDLRADPGAVMHEVYAHVGVDPDRVDSTTASPERNRLLRPRSRRLHRASMRAATWSSEAPGLLRWPVRRSTGLVNRLNLTQSIPSMPEATRSRLAALFAPANGDLSAWLRRSLPWPSDRVRRDGSRSQSGGASPVDARREPA